MASPKRPAPAPPPRYPWQDKRDPTWPFGRVQRHGPTPPPAPPPAAPF